MKRCSWLIAVAVLLSACGRGDAEERLSGIVQIPVRVLGPDGIEQPREAANLLRYALALIPAALFGRADSTTLRQLTAEQTRVPLDAASLEAWAKAGAKTWLPGSDDHLQITPADVRVARVMTAAFADEGESRLGVGFHDLAEDTNLILVYVDRACSVVGEHGAVAGVPAGVTNSAVHLELRFPAAGVYWVRTAREQSLAVVAPHSPTLDVYIR